METACQRGAYSPICSIDIFFARSDCPCFVIYLTAFAFSIDMMKTKRTSLGSTFFTSDNDGHTYLPSVFTFGGCIGRVLALLHLKIEAVFTCGLAFLELFCGAWGEGWLLRVSDGGNGLSVKKGCGHGLWVVKITADHLNAAQSECLDSGLERIAGEATEGSNSEKRNKKEKQIDLIAYITFCPSQFLDDLLQTTSICICTPTTRCNR